MPPLLTAKILLFIALSLGHRDAHTIYATSSSESYTWMATSAGWTVEMKGFPASDFTRNPSRKFVINGTPTRKEMPEYLQAVSQHHWGHHDALVLSNGDRVETHGHNAFYIINAGGANERDYTLSFAAK